MKAFLLVCLIATSMMVNAIDNPEDQVVSAETDSPSFLHVEQACTQTCCFGVCCQTGTCGKTGCGSPIYPWSCVEG